MNASARQNAHEDPGSTTVASSTGEHAAPRFAGSIFGSGRRWIAVDTGSSSIRVLRPGSPGRLLSSPTVLAIERGSQEIVALGAAARRMEGRMPPGLALRYPVRHGAIADPASVEVLLRDLIARLPIPGPTRLVGPAIVVATPAELTSVQRHALYTSLRNCGAGRVACVPTSIAAGLGADLPVFDAGACGVIDFGAERTEISVLSLGGTVVTRSIASGASDLSAAIGKSLRQQHNLLIGRPTAEEILREVASCTPAGADHVHVARGRDSRYGRPVSVEIKARELVPVIREALAPLRAALLEVLERVPAELASDLADRGFHLTGGGSRLEGFPEFVAESCGLEAYLQDDPELAIVRGCGRIAAQSELLALIEAP